MISKGLLQSLNETKMDRITFLKSLLFFVVSVIGAGHFLSLFKNYDFRPPVIDSQQVQAGNGYNRGTYNR